MTGVGGTAAGAPSGRPPVVLTVAGTDSGGGAGIAADLRTFHELGVHGALAVTAVTAQDTRRVAAVHGVPATFVAEQIAVVAADLVPAAVKTGMLGNAEVVHAVARALRAPGWGQPAVVVDPVLAASTGGRLLDDDGLAALRTALLPLAAVVTPNLAEAGALLGRVVGSVADMRRAAADLVALGAGAAVVTGGHLPGEPLDVLCAGGAVLELRGTRVGAAGSHGGGCTFSAAVAAHLALGAGVEDAVRAAKAFVTEAIRAAAAPGGGHGAVVPGGRAAGVRRGGG